MEREIAKIKIVNQLELFGLQPKEAEVYLAALELEPVSVQQLTDKTGFVRTSVYNYIESLKEKRFLDEVIIKKRKYYVAIAPEKLKDILAYRKLQIEQTEEKIPDLMKNIDTFLPSESSLKDINPTRPEVYYYEGEKGLKNIYEDTLKVGKDIYTFTAWDDMLEILPIYLPEYVNRRAAAGMHSHCIAIRSSISEDIKKRDSIENRTTKFLESDEKMSVETIIYGNKIAFLYFDGSCSGVIIDNADFAKAQKTIFLALWNKLKA